METRMNELRELFGLKDPDIRSYSPLTLAYIGDGVYELVIRTILVKKGNCPVNRHTQESQQSCESSRPQSAIMEKIEEHLTQGRT